MKCLENYTIEQIKEMSSAELDVLWENVVAEEMADNIRNDIIDRLTKMEEKKPKIES